MEEKKSVTKEQLASVIADYLKANKIAVVGFEATKNNVLGLLDKIGETVYLDGVFKDGLEFMNGNNLPAGKTIEEYFIDFIAPQDYEKDSGLGNVQGPEISTRPVTYSYTLGRKKWKLKSYYNDLQRAFSTEEGAINAINTILERLSKSYLMWRYEAKKGLLGIFADKAQTAMTASKTYTTKTAYGVGESIKDANGNVAIVFKKILASNTLTWQQAIDAGYLSPINLVSSIDSPIDEEAGESFIIAVKEIIEDMDYSNHQNLNGALVLPTPDTNRRLVVNCGIVPKLEVKTLAGAFHEDKLLFPVTMSKVQDFGKGHSDIIAILYDDRGAKLYNSYNALRSSELADDDAMLSVQHTEDTAFISCNTFIHVFKKKA